MSIDTDFARNHPALTLATQLTQSIKSAGGLAHPVALYKLKNLALALKVYSISQSLDSEYQVPDCSFIEGSSTHKITVQETFNSALSQSGILMITHALKNIQEIKHSQALLNLISKSDEALKYISQLLERSPDGSNTEFFGQRNTQHVVNTDYYSNPT